MSANGVAQLLIYLAVLLVLVKPVGGSMAAVYEGRPAASQLAIKLDGKP